MNIIDALKEKRLIFDGGMGTMIDPKDIPEGSIPESMVLNCPQKITDIHKAYIDAGADVITTATFGANALKLKPFGMTVKEVYEAGVSCAKNALKLSGKKAFIAGDIGPLGKLLSPIGDLAFDDAYDLFFEMAKAAEEAGADLILIETINDAYELKASVLAAKEAVSIPVIATVAADEKGKLLTGAPIEAVGALLQSLGIDGAGLNCSFGPDKMIKTAERLYNSCSLPLIINPNAGLPRALPGGKAEYDMDEKAFASYCRDLAPFASAMGGCCGTDPGYIKCLIEEIKDIPLPVKKVITKTIVTSGMEAVEIGPDSPVIIGERINPTGKKLLKEALRSGDVGSILKEGIRQQDAGAHILDINTGLPGIDEADAMVNIIHQLQGMISCPLQIDSSDPAVLEAAMRMVNGKPVINSVTGSKKSMDTLFPLVKKYGGAVVGLTLDEKGIPDTAEGRFSIAEKIVEEAAKYGIEKYDILIDPLTMAVSAGQDARVTLDAIKLIRERLSVNTILGVSNISFGLPRRDIINASFLSMALNAGLTAAIMDPLSDTMMDAFRGSMVLTSKDKNCDNYTSLYAESKETKNREMSSHHDLFQAIINGLSSDAAASASEELKSFDPMSVIEEKLIPALDLVGQRFEEGTLYLPQLLMSAQAAESAFSVLKAAIEKKAHKDPALNKTVLVATVHGDIHDIGKNIVKVLLESYGFNVVDLGKDVPPEKILEAVRRSDIRLVGLSALMTTTLPAMEDTIKLLRSNCPLCKIVVGGAVLTKEHAGKIGADKYAKTAMDTVKYAQTVL